MVMWWRRTPTKTMTTITGIRTQSRMATRERKGQNEMMLHYIIFKPGSRIMRCLSRWIKKHVRKKRTIKEQAHLRISHFVYFVYKIKAKQKKKNGIFKLQEKKKHTRVLKCILSTFWSRNYLGHRVQTCKETVVRICNWFSRAQRFHCYWKLAW